MAAGKPICCNIDIYMCPIRTNDIGIAQSFSNSKEYASAIESLLNMSQEQYKSMAKRAESAAKEYDYKVLADKLSKVLTKVLS